MTRAEHVLMIFTRLPVAGEVKTRLIPELGPAGALELYLGLADNTFSTATESGFDSVQLWLTDPGPDNKHLNHWRRKYQFEYHRQQGADLGERMNYAFARAWSKFRIAILIGCDCPVLHRNDLTRARETLSHEQPCGVMGPTEDGGYYLIGLNSHAPSLFKDIIWGRPDVAGRTREKAKGINMNLYELERKWDVDTIEDLHRLARLRPDSSEGKEGLRIQ